MKEPSAKNVYREVRDEAELQEIFRTIRRDVQYAASRPALTELYKRAGYLITLTHTPAWAERLQGRVSQIREVGMDEFAITARSINHRAAEIGVRADYDEAWGR